MSLDLIDRDSTILWPASSSTGGWCSDIDRRLAELRFTSNLAGAGLEDWVAGDALSASDEAVRLAVGDAADFERVMAMVRLAEPVSRLTPIWSPTATVAYNTTDESEPAFWVTNLGDPPAESDVLSWKPSRYWDPIFSIYSLTPEVVDTSSDVIMNTGESTSGLLPLGLCGYVSIPVDIGKTASVTSVSTVVGVTVIGAMLGAVIGGAVSGGSMLGVAGGAMIGGAIGTTVVARQAGSAVAQTVPRFPRLLAAMREGRIKGAGLPAPGNRKLRLVETEPPAAEAEQIGFGRSGTRPDDAPRRPRLR